MQELKKMNIMNVKNLEMTRRIVQVTTIVASIGLVILGSFTPWSQEIVTELFHYNLFLGLTYFLPMIGLLVINGSVKRYFNRRVKNISTNRRLPVETVSVMQERSEIQQLQQIEYEKWKRSMLQLRRRLGGPYF